MLSTRNDISIVEIVFYSFFLIIAIFLIRLFSSIRNLNRGSQWLYIIILSLLRIIGSGLELATIKSPTSVGLYIGATICQGIGVSPLFLAAACILLRANEGKDQISMGGMSFSRFYRLIQLIMLVGLILGIVGGNEAGTHLADTGVYQPQTLSKVSVALFIVAFVMILAGVALTTTHIHSSGQHFRPLWVVLLLSLPLLLVRLIYSAISTFGHSSDFNLADGNVWVFLGMSIIMEIIVILMYEVAGLIERFNGMDDAARQDLEMQQRNPQVYQQGKLPTYAES